MNRRDFIQQTLTASAVLAGLPTTALTSATTIQTPIVPTIQRFQWADAFKTWLWKPQAFEQDDFVAAQDGSPLGYSMHRSLCRSWTAQLRPDTEVGYITRERHSCLSQALLTVFYSHPIYGHFGSSGGDVQRLREKPFPNPPVLYPDGYDITNIDITETVYYHEICRVMAICYANRIENPQEPEHDFQSIVQAPTNGGNSFNLIDIDEWHSMTI